MNNKQIRLSGETLAKLKTLGQPFESVDDCLKRVLECSRVEKETKSVQKPTESEQ